MKTTSRMTKLTSSGTILKQNAVKNIRATNVPVEYFFVPVEYDKFGSEVDVDVVDSEQTDKQKDGVEGKDSSSDHESCRKLLQQSACHREKKYKAVEGVVDIVEVSRYLAVDLVGRLDQDLPRLVQHEDGDPGVEHQFRLLGGPCEVEDGHVGVEKEEDKI